MDDFEDKLKAFLEMFNEDVPNPEQEPIRFAHYVKMFNYYTKPADLVVQPEQAQ